MSKKQELITKEETPLVVQNLDEWGAPPQLSSKDTIVSKIHLMQGLSKKVTANQAKMGELRDSVTNELFGDYKTAMEFIPFHMQPLWVESQWNQQSKKYDYLRTIPVTPDNDDLPYEDEAAGIKRTRTMNFYVLLPKEIEAGTAVTRILSFASTSRRGGQKLATQMYVTNRMQKKAPAATVMLLKTEQQSNDKGTFAIKDVDAARAATDKELEAALQWFKLVKGPNNLKVDDSDSLVDEASELDLEAAGNF